jgi:hypothetical protein
MTEELCSSVFLIQSDIASTAIKKQRHPCYSPGVPLFMSERNKTLLFCCVQKIPYKNRLSSEFSEPLPSQQNLCFVDRSSMQGTPVAVNLILWTACTITPP